MSGMDSGGGGGGDASRPALGFPLGTALLLLVIFCLSGVFSCCYHWDKLQALRRRRLARSLSDSDSSPDDAIPSPRKSSPLPPDRKFKQSLSLPVMMPGDRIPKYIAWPAEPSPRAPPADKITVEVQRPPLLSSSS